MSYIEEFQEAFPSLESYWRSIVLFGRNVASYKFALAKSLLELIHFEHTSISLEELAGPFSKYLCEHLLIAPKQATSNSSQFLEACKQYNTGDITQDQLLDITVKKGFNNVIDAFHIVNNSEIPVQFYQKDYDGRSKKIVLTDNVYKLHEIPFSKNLFDEAESR